MQNIDIIIPQAISYNDFNNALGIQHHNLSIAIVLIYLRMAFVNLIATRIIFNIRASSSHIGMMIFIPFVWEQRGVIAAVADQTAMISHILPMCWATRRWSWGHVGAVWEPRIDRVKLAFAL